MMKNSEIDWDEAPEWCIAHGFKESGLGIKEFWLGEDVYQRLDQQKAFRYGGGDPSCGSFYNSRFESFSYVAKRPEQIAAGERERIILQMALESGWHVGVGHEEIPPYFGILYDAGYRKQVKP
jgi:hypothetical protein